MMSEIKKCPYCAEEIKAEATKCKHCGSILPENIDFLDEVEKGWESQPLIKGGVQRKCLVCGYRGNMKTWLRNHIIPQLIMILLLLVYIVPGIIFILWAWGKYKCPKCGALAKNIPS